MEETWKWCGLWTRLKAVAILLLSAGLAPAAPADTRAIVSHVNRYRASHGAPAVVWDPSLESASSQWASVLSKRSDGLVHGSVGENLAWFSGGAPPSDTDAILRSVDMWYSESSRYDYKLLELSPATGHFTQLVWSATSAIGAAATSSSTRGTVVVMRFSPPGNVVGQFASNVRTPVPWPVAPVNTAEPILSLILPPPLSSHNKTPPPPLSSQNKTPPPPLSSQNKTPPPPLSSQNKTPPPPLSATSKVVVKVAPELQGSIVKTLCPALMSSLPFKHTEPCSVLLTSGSGVYYGTRVLGNPWLFLKAFMSNFTKGAKLPCGSVVAVTPDQTPSSTLRLMAACTAG